MRGRFEVELSKFFIFQSLKVQDMASKRAINSENF